MKAGYAWKQIIYLYTWKFTNWNGHELGEVYSWYK